MKDLPIESTRVIQLGEALVCSLREIETATGSSTLTQSQVRKMRDMIQQRIEAVRLSQLPPRLMRHRYLTRETIDSWPFGDPLVKQICEFEERYNNL